VACLSPGTGPTITADMDSHRIQPSPRCPSKAVPTGKPTQLEAGKANRLMHSTAQRKFPPAIQVHRVITTGGKTTHGETVSGAGFPEILRTEGGGWPSLSIPKELKGASDTVVIFVGSSLRSPNLEGARAYLTRGRCRSWDTKITGAER
jgi:hypothetical protein